MIVIYRSTGAGVEARVVDSIERARALWLETATDCWAEIYRDGVCVAGHNPSKNPRRVYHFRRRFEHLWAFRFFGDNHAPARLLRVGPFEIEWTAGERPLQKLLIRRYNRHGPQPSMSLIGGVRTSR